MESMPDEEKNLTCPQCKREVDTVHPYYTASQHLMFLTSTNVYTWWILISILAAIFWPLGIAAYIVLYIYEIKSSKNKKLYKCLKCNTQLSYNEVNNGEGSAT